MAANKNVFTRPIKDIMWLADQLNDPHSSCRDDTCVVSSGAYGERTKRHVLPAEIILAVSKADLVQAIRVMTTNHHTITVQEASTRGTYRIILQGEGAMEWLRACAHLMKEPPLRL